MYRTVVRLESWQVRRAGDCLSSVGSRRGRVERWGVAPRMNLAETTFINSTLRVRELRDRVGPDVLGRGSLRDVDRILEVGCGQGIGLLLLADRFPTAQLVGVDLDPGMIRRARRRVAALGDRVELRVDDLSSLPDPAGSFDVVVDFAAVHHVPDWRSALSEIAECCVRAESSCSRITT
jgi:SAM-dependent methyltransferase